MTPPNYYDDLVQRLAALEQGVSLDQLPLADLRRALLDNGEPLDLKTLALAGQIADFGPAYPKIRFGGGSISFVASTVDSGSVTIPHGLGSVPLRVFLSLSGAAPAPPIALTAQSYGAINFSVTARAGSAITFTQTFDWLAIG
jgi:hypothetical protein